MKEHIKYFVKNKSGNYGFRKDLNPFEKKILGKNSIQFSLKTNDIELALKKFKVIEDNVLTFLDSLKVNPNSPAIEKLEKAKFIASLYKFDYKPSYKLEEEIVNRVLKILHKNNLQQKTPDQHLEAVLGTVTPSDINLKQLVKQYYMITRHELSGKNEKQIKRWEHSHNRPVDVLISLIGNLQLVNLNQSHGLILRDHLFKRIKTKEMVATTANSHFHCLTKMLKTVDKHLQLNMNTEIFKNIIFKD